MVANQNSLEFERYATQGPQSALEQKFIQEYLRSKGYSLEELRSLPKDQASQLMQEASTYASLHLAEVESRARFKEEIRW